MPTLTTSASPTELSYTDSGAGRPVVLIHGWPLSHRAWEPQVGPLIEAGFRVVAYDRRGFGDSGRPFEGYDYDTFASDLNDLLEELDLRDAALVGFSMGGGEVARFLGRYGADRVSKAVLVSAVTPFMLKTDDNPDGVEQKVFDDMLENVREDRAAFLGEFVKMFFNQGLLKRPVSEDALHYHQMIGAFAQPFATEACVTAFAATDFRPDMAAFTVPTLVVHGDADQIVPIEAGGERAAAMIPGARYHIVEGGPHGLNLTHKEEFNEVLIGFLQA